MELDGDGDGDGDGFTTPSIGTRCTSGTLTLPYYAAPDRNDCDDADDTRWALSTYLALDA
jgi:hypothetical protein